MLPSVAGAVVPIYNIPELKHLKGGVQTLILSRLTLAKIYTGKIRYWGHASIVRDANTTSRSVARALQSLSTTPINVVVRQDSSGTSEIFSGALAKFDPKGVSSPDYSFEKLGTAGSTPTWCDPTTDEIQDIYISGCNATTDASSPIHLKIVKAAGTSMGDVFFHCNDSVAKLATLFGNASLSVYPVSKGVSYGKAFIDSDGDSSASTSTDSYSVVYRIAYPYGGLSGKNWYQPVVVSTPPGVSVLVNTFQEGGLANTPFVNGATKKTTTLIQSVWMYANTTSSHSHGNSSWAVFNFYWASSSSSSASTEEFNVSASINTTSPWSDLSAKIKTAINAVRPGTVTAVSRKSYKIKWTEYQVTFSTSAGLSGLFASLGANVTEASPDMTARMSSIVYVTVLTTANNYPMFYDSSNPRGYSYSGK